jgi:hypothetical protein
MALLFVSRVSMFHVFRDLRVLVELKKFIQARVNWFFIALNGNLILMMKLLLFCQQCRNPSFGFVTKAKGLQGCEPKGSLGVKAKRSQGCGPRRSPIVTSHTPGSVRKYEGV